MIGQRGTWLTGLALAVAFSAVAPSVASASNYSIRLAPQTVPSGSSSTITATITNISANSVGSVNMIAPSGFSVTGATIAPPATAQIVNGVVQLRHLGIARGSSKMATLTVSAPCVVVTNALWTVVAKSPPDFKGAALAPDPESPPPTTSTTGACGLRVTTQPTNVEVGSPITPAVKVSVVDGALNPTNAAIPITVALATGPAGAVLNGTKTVTSSQGVATFADLSVTKAGTGYTLTATSPGTPSATSAPFRADQDVVTCASNQSCTASATISGFVPGSNPPIPYTNSFTVTAAPSANGGTLTASYNIGKDFDCSAPQFGGYQSVSPDRGVFNGPNSEKVVRSTTAKALLTAANRTAASLRYCFVAPYPFSLGFLAGNSNQTEDVDGDGNPDYKGILPQCFDVILGLLVPPPCQESASADSNGNGVVVARIKASPLDPAGRS